MKRTKKIEDEILHQHGAYPDSKTEEGEALGFDELKALGEISEQISIGIFDEENLLLNLYATLHGEQWKESSKIDLDEPHAMQKIYGGWQQNKKSIQIDLSGEELKAYNHFRSQYSNLKFPEERWVIHCAFFSKGVLTFSTKTPHEEQTMQLLERFAQVFDGTYTRPHGSVWAGRENPGIPHELRVIET